MAHDELEAALNLELFNDVVKVLPIIIGNDENATTIIKHYPILNSKLHKRFHGEF
jgi:hypothetical protein